MTQIKFFKICYAILVVPHYEYGKYADKFVYILFFITLHKKYL